MPQTNLASSTEKNEQNLSDKIGSLLRNPEFVVDDNSKATLRFTVNASNQIVVLTVDTENSEIKNFVIERLNYHLLDFNYPKKMKVINHQIKFIKLLRKREIFENILSPQFEFSLKKSVAKFVTLFFIPLYIP
jgi:hypothetical protein